MSYVNCVSDTESEPDQTKEVVETLEKKPVKKRAPRKPKAEPVPVPENEEVPIKKKRAPRKPKAKPEPEPVPETEEVPIKKKRAPRKPKAEPEVQPVVEQVVEPKPKKERQPTEAQKMALEKAREKRRIAKKTKQEVQFTTQPTSIIFV